MADRYVITAHYQTPDSGALLLITDANRGHMRALGYRCFNDGDIKMLMEMVEMANKGWGASQKESPVKEKT